MALHPPKALLLHAVLANLSVELTTLDEMISRPARLPPELLLIVRAHLLASLTRLLFEHSVHALAKYEDDLQRLLCPDCISYNHDIYGPDVWQWQQFSGPCNCNQTLRDTTSKSSNNLQQFVNPHHWLEHHLSLRVALLSPMPSSSSSIWDVVTYVLNQHHCELLKEDLDDLTEVQGSPLSPSGINIFYYRRMINFYGTCKQSRAPPTIRIQPLQSALRLLESKGIGEAGEVGDMLRADIILCQASQNLGLALELKDVFNSPRQLPEPTLWSSRKVGASDIPMYGSTLLVHFSTSPVLRGVVKTYSFLSAVLAACVSMPMTVATLALTIVCFYSRPIALRVGV